MEPWTQENSDSASSLLNLFLMWENIYSDDVLSKVFTAQEITLDRKVFLFVFFIQPFSFVGFSAHKDFNICVNLNILKKTDFFFFHTISNFDKYKKINCMEKKIVLNFSHLIVISHWAEKCLCCILMKNIYLIIFKSKFYINWEFS